MKHIKMKQEKPKTVQIKSATLREVSLFSMPQCLKMKISFLKSANYFTELCSDLKKSFAKLSPNYCSNIVRV